MNAFAVFALVAAMCAVSYADTSCKDLVYDTKFDVLKYLEDKSGKMKVCSSLSKEELGSVGTFDPKTSIYSIGKPENPAEKSYKYAKADSLGEGFWSKVNTADESDKQIRKVTCVYDDNEGNSLACFYSCRNDNVDKLIGYSCYLTGTKFYEQMKKCVKDAKLPEESFF